ncbi:hypothetical protein PYCCODRAFT_1434830 [Trametes coccinea BRFM310]|uniref:Uncharacterized protein n=1 Tax=Trametes coccinea (strain BRFM310) TaxID=1353009 RepID=A0A1Y2ISM4_TRAC3|nr:hypothetical protein PYCCODRAFT_1434830 [Trametes coccinea BRFM310]
MRDSDVKLESLSDAMSTPLSPAAPPASPSVSVRRAASSTVFASSAPAPSVRVITIPSAFLAIFPSSLLLDVDRNNWHEWSRKIIDNLLSARSELTTGGARMSGASVGERLILHSHMYLE